ncbi:hypothetical protein [Streptomyces sp. AK04-3B]|uniref:hypothetical protein n=1 Tax=unclassified Streptomyces TaxID=2593676 RepID=UPI0029A1B63E|nr:hypothetical protein [Streptomyces sp. AK04-3B]MDX3798927.1 hypothetical protein [Streptomyces sp. AK04-3B]
MTIIAQWPTLPAGIDSTGFESLLGLGAHKYAALGPAAHLNAPAAAVPGCGAHGHVGIDDGLSTEK